MSSYNGDEHEDDNRDDDVDEVPQREEEPEEWMLLCGLNQRYYDTISRGSQSHENLQFYWTGTARAMPPHLLRESSSWITKRRNDTLENPPLGDKPVYAFPSQSSSLLAQHGHSIYGLFETVVMLSENIRQAGNNPEAEQFRAILIRLRDGETNQDEWMTLSEDTTARKHE